MSAYDARRHHYGIRTSMENMDDSLIIPRYSHIWPYTGQRPPKEPPPEPPDIPPNPPPENMPDEAESDVADGEAI